MSVSRIVVRRAAALACILCLLGAASAGGAGGEVEAAAPDAASPGELRSYATIYSIGMEWDLVGDANHNAACTVRYRPRGAAEWKRAMDLLRIDCANQYGDNKSDRPYNMLAGSIMFLSPAAAYEVRLELSDPDGGREVRDTALATRPLPQLSAGGRTLHVRPGSEGGDGSESRPFGAPDAAQAAAGPGDRILLHKGDYGEFTFSRAGEEGRHVAWLAAGDGDAVFRRATVAAGHVWLEGLALRRAEGAGGQGLTADGACRGVVVRRCRFSGYHYSITLRPECAEWYIADNVIVGDKTDVNVSDISGEGVELNHSGGHTVAHNRISHVADGVSYALRNCDIFGNDIRDVTDDGIEPDYGYANIRMWGNRMHGVFNHTVSFQPQFCGPWYIVRNEMSARRQVLKPNMADRYVLVGNTLVGFGRTAQGRADLLMKAFSRNNLWILVRDEAARPAECSIWSAHGRQREGPYNMPYQGRPDWRSDLDYDGFDPDGAGMLLQWDTGGGRPEPLRDLAAVAQVLGIERHGRVVSRREVFDVPDVAGYMREAFSARRLALKAGCAAVDAGQVVPNIAEDFAGAAPDLGAHEFGKPAAHYGPRP